MNHFLKIFKIKDLRYKVLMVALILVAYRVLAAIPIPGVEAERLQAFFETNQFFGFLSIFSGGGLSNLSIVMLGVGPYITATIIMQLLTIIFPRIKEIYYEQGARGQAKFNQYARMLTVPFAALQGYGFLSLLIANGIIDRPEFFNLMINVAVITGGSMIALWFGELINEYKIGNGISLIILAGILSSVPGTVQLAFASYSAALLPVYVAFIATFVAIIAGIVYLNEGERKVPIAYARRVRGNKLYGGVASYLPVKVNSAGMIPLIFAIAVLFMPQFVVQITSTFAPELSLRLNDILTTQFFTNQLLYGVVYFVLVFTFTYFYTAVTFNPEEVSKNLQRSGGFIPGIRPGGQTAQYFARLINRVTFLGATALGLVAVLPLVVQRFTGIPTLTISGTAILIVVAVALEVMRQVNSQLTVRGYEAIE